MSNAKAGELDDSLAAIEHRPTEHHRQDDEVQLLGDIARSLPDALSTHLATGIKSASKRAGGLPNGLARPRVQHQCNTPSTALATKPGKCARSAD
jgi:hypothetical protein